MLKIAAIGAFAWKVLCFGDADLAAQQIDQIFSVALIQHRESSFARLLDRQTAQHEWPSE
jgi:hypothetical protein